MSKKPDSSDRLYSSVAGRGKLVLKGGVEKKKKKKDKADPNEIKIVSETVEQAEERRVEAYRKKSDKFCK